MDTETVDVLHAIAQTDVALGVAGLPDDDIFRRELRAAGSAMAELIEADREYDRAKEEYRFVMDGEGLKRRKAIREYHAAIARRNAALSRLGGSA